MQHINDYTLESSETEFTATRGTSSTGSRIRRAAIRPGLARAVWKWKENFNLILYNIELLFARWNVSNKAIWTCVKKKGSDTEPQHIKTQSYFDYLLSEDEIFDSDLSENEDEEEIYLSCFMIKNNVGKANVGNFRGHVEHGDVKEFTDNEMEPMDAVLEKNVRRHACHQVVHQEVINGQTGSHVRPQHIEDQEVQSELKNLALPGCNPVYFELI